MNPEAVYIEPAIKLYSSFDKALSADEEWDRYLSSEEQKWRFSILQRLTKICVVAEPGYGKTRLLREIVLEANNQGKEAILIECKKITGPSAAEFILNQAQNVSPTKSEGFQLKNEETIIVCFDALDEVKSQDFSGTVDKIRSFLADYDKLTTIVSCRWHFLKKYKEVVSDLAFQYLRIFPFSRKQVRSYLESLLSG